MPTAPDGWARTALSPDDELNQALRESNFSGAKYIDVNPSQQAFRLIFPDSTRIISGTYEFTGTEFTIKQFHLEADGESVTMDLNTFKQVVAIKTSKGDSWVRSDDTVMKENASREAGVNGYLAANEDLLELARIIDEENGYVGSGGSGGSEGTGGVTSPVIEKETTHSGLSTGVRAVLTMLAVLWAPLFGVLQPLVAIFTTGVIIDTVMTTRYDGQWTATSGQSNLLINISAGRITQIVETAGNQEFTLLDSRMTTNSEGRVVWEVLAQVPGQDIDVEFTFDMMEVDKNNLDGTLTALSSEVARVPMTMTRV
jgi:hypothetical protein